MWGWQQRAAFPHFPRRYGVTYYNSRCSRLVLIPFCPPYPLQPFRLALQSQSSPKFDFGKLAESATTPASLNTLSHLSPLLLTPFHHSAASARVSPDGRWLAFVSSRAPESPENTALPHWSTSALYCLDMNSLRDSVQSKFAQIQLSWSILWSTTIKTLPKPLPIEVPFADDLNIITHTILSASNDKDPNGSSTSDRFLGLYLPAGLLHHRLWCSTPAANTWHMLISTTHYSQQRLLLVSFDGDVQVNTRWIKEPTHVIADDDVKIPLNLPSIDICDFAIDGCSIALVAVSAINCPPTLFSLDLSLGSFEQLTQPQLPRFHAEAITGLTFTTIQHRAHGATDETFETILILPSQPKGPLSLVLYPHGGPHSSFTTSYASSLVFLCNAIRHTATTGTALALVNYRGSVGCSQELLESLPRAGVGSTDVADCLQAIDEVLERTPSIDPNSVTVFGGSHGGFLVGHLISYRTKDCASHLRTLHQKISSESPIFISAVARNPVLNIAQNLGMTDIGDWCGYECALPHHPGSVYTTEQYARMYAMSPISKAAEMCTPVCLMLGSSDRRVPMSQSFELSRVLTARGLRNRVIVYPEAQHGLTDKLEFESNNVINSALWLSCKWDSSNLDL